MDATFRLRRSFRNKALGLLTAFLAWFVLTIYLLGTDAKIPNRLAMAAGLGSVPLFMAGLSAWMLAAYWREELAIREELVTFRGIFREKSLDLRDVTEARWQNSQVVEGRVLLRTESTSLAINLNNYEIEEQERIVLHLRSILAPEIQVGWNLFAYHTEQRVSRAARTKPGPDEILIRRDRWDRSLLPTLAVASLAGFAAWWFTGKGGYLGLPLAPLVGWALIRFTTPTEGMVAQKLSASMQPEMTRFLMFSVLWVMVLAAGLVLNQYFRPETAQQFAILIVWSVVWFGDLVFEIHRLDRREALRDREAADLAAKARGEPMGDVWQDE